MDESNQLVRFIQSKLTAEDRVVAVRASDPFGAVTKRVDRIQDIHCRSPGRQGLFDLRNFVPRDNLCNDCDHHRRTQWLFAFLFDLGFRRIGLAAFHRGGKKLAELFAGITADDIKAPGT